VFVLSIILSLAAGLYIVKKMNSRDINDKRLVLGNNNPNESLLHSIGE
jgi:hypothetical protein